MKPRVCPDCGYEIETTDYCVECDMQRQAHEALYPDDGGMSWREEEDLIGFCDNCHHPLDQHGDCPICEYDW